MTDRATGLVLARAGSPKRASSFTGSPQARAGSARWPRAPCVPAPRSAAGWTFFTRPISAFARSRRSDLHTLREVSLRETHPALRQDLGRLRQAAYAAALIEQTTETDTPLPAIFDLVREFLEAVTLAPPHPRTVFAFEFKLLTELGLQPDWETSRLTAGAKQLTSAFAESDWPAVARLGPSAAQTAEVRRFLDGFLAYHLGKIPKGRNAACG